MYHAKRKIRNENVVERGNSQGPGLKRLQCQINAVKIAVESFGSSVEKSEVVRIEIEEQRLRFE